MKPRVIAEVSQTDLARAFFMLRNIPDGVTKAQVKAMNRIANEARTRILTESIKDINLRRDFLKERIHGPNQVPKNKASFNRPEARVTARRRGLLLSHFANSRKTSLQEIGGRLRPLVEVKVKARGRHIKMPSAFFLRLKRGTESGDQYGIFVRPKGGKLKHLYGPSPSQIMNQEIPVVAPDLQAKQRSYVDQEVSELLRRAVRGV